MALQEGFWCSLYEGAGYYLACCAAAMCIAARSRALAPREPAKPPALPSPAPDAREDALRQAVCAVDTLAAAKHA